MMSDVIVGNDVLRVFKGVLAGLVVVISLWIVANLSQLVIVMMLRITRNIWCNWCCESLATSVKKDVASHSQHQLWCFGPLATFSPAQLEMLRTRVSYKRRLRRCEQPSLNARNFWSFKLCFQNSCWYSWLWFSGHLFRFKMASNDLNINWIH